MSYINISHIKTSTKKIFLSLARVVWLWTSFPKRIVVDIWTSVWPVCIALILWMLNGNKIFDDSLNLVFVYICTSFLIFSPLTLYCILQALNLNACIISWGGGKEWGKVSNHSICICESENVDELCILQMLRMLTVCLL